MSCGHNRPRRLLGRGGTSGAHVLLEHVAMHNRAAEGVGLGDAHGGADVGRWPRHGRADPLTSYHRCGAGHLGGRIGGRSDGCSQGPEHAEGGKEQPPAGERGGKALVPPTFGRGQWRDKRTSLSAPSGGLASLALVGKVLAACAHLSERGLGPSPHNVSGVPVAHSSDRAA
jgi:hypothetical protein